MATFGILVGGGPAPGINGVIGAATILARESGARVLGLVDGLQWLMQGDAGHSIELGIAQVSRVHLLGGSILQTSRADATKEAGDLARVILPFRSTVQDWVTSATRSNTIRPSGAALRDTRTDCTRAGAACTMPLGSRAAGARSRKMWARFGSMTN